VLLWLQWQNDAAQGSGRAAERERRRGPAREWVGRQDVAGAYAVLVVLRPTAWAGCSAVTVALMRLHIARNAQQATHSRVRSSYLQGTAVQIAAA
jgi:hypothetical protein